MNLYRKVVYVLVPRYEGEEQYNGFWDILYTEYDEGEIARYEACTDAEYRCGAYMSPSMANYAFGYEFYMKLEV